MLQEEGQLEEAEPIMATVCRARMRTFGQASFCYVSCYFIFYDFFSYSTLLCAQLREAGPIMATGSRACVRTFGQTTFQPSWSGPGVCMRCGVGGKGGGRALTPNP
jgi:hypothetical protein